MDSVMETNIGNASIGTSSTLFVAPNEARMFLSLNNPSNVGVYLNFGEAAEDNKGHYLGARGGNLLITIGDFRLSLAVYAIAPAGTSEPKIVTYLEGY